MHNKQPRGPLVSVIIATKNEEKNIEICLKSVVNQTYRNLEIIIVDNCSIDKTVDICKKYTNRIYLVKPNRASQLNYGVKRARGKYIIFPDADMILSPRLVEECVKMCENEGYDALYIPEVILGRGIFGRLRNFERSFYVGTYIDCVRFVKRNIFLKISGFDESLEFGPDDWDFDRRIRMIAKIGIVSECIYHNEMNLNFSRYIYKKIKYMRALRKYIDKWGKNDPIIKRQLGFAYRLFWIFMEDGKWKRFFSNIGLAVGVIFMKALVGLFYVIYKFTY